MPYRDENDTLRAENERLRAELTRTRERKFPKVTGGLIALLVVLAFALQPWLNAASDGRFAGAIVILGVVALGALFAAFRQV